MGNDCPTSTSLTPGHGKGIPVISKDSATLPIRITSYKGRTPIHCLVLVSFPMPSVLALQPTTQSHCTPKITYCLALQPLGVSGRAGTICPWPVIVLFPQWQPWDARKYQCKFAVANFLPWQLSAECCQHSCCSHCAHSPLSCTAPLTELPKLQCLSQGALIWPLNEEQHIFIGKGVSPGKQLWQWQEISARQEKRELVQELQHLCDFWIPSLCFTHPLWLGASCLSIWIPFVLSHQFVKAFRDVSGN